MEYIPKALKIGRTYIDFQNHIEENEISSWVEMDTVTGRIGGKAILTLHFKFCSFMCGILLCNKTSAEVSAKILALKNTFEENSLSFGDIFPLLLTDNGGEFAGIFSIENDLRGGRETSLFFATLISQARNRMSKRTTHFFGTSCPRVNPSTSLHRKR
jgi:IS30 family transposase